VTVHYLPGRMAETLIPKRWSARILAIATLVAVAFVARAGASASAAPATDTLDRPGVSVQPAQAVVGHAHSKGRGDVVRSGGPLPAPPFVASVTAGEPSRDYSWPCVALHDAATVTGYDATAPPRNLLT